MAKKKNKGKKNAWSTVVTPWLRDNKVWLAALGGVVGGAAVTAALASQSGQSTMDDLATSVKAMMPGGDGTANHPQDAGPQGDAAQKPSPATTA